ncbi:hypothetical protein DY000_02005489 [Brassica cretica]|uniref:Zinc knuckle CX2CX4HX4C domain-containing protein n=1 Tax=Brassica cretica TaxID=69181 RepID=A0ABQ7BX59_BRACR|nr:hypothetical protein DY000_02005489 [Brassica cretica]
MFVLVRWEPIVHDDYPWIIPFWTRLIGVPLHLWTDNNLKGIGSRLGHVHQDTIELMEGIMLIYIDTRRPLKFARKAESPEEDEVTIEIKYEMLFKHCSTCGMLTHEKKYCPSVNAQARILPPLNRPGVFARVQVPEERAQYQPVEKEPQTRTHITRSHSEHKSQHFNGSRYGHSERRYNPEFVPSRDESRAGSGPYDRHQGVAWREKKSNGSTIHDRKRSERKSTWEAQGIRRLASTIVTPARIDHDMDENVTKHAKGSPRALSFNSLGEKDLMPADRDDQIIDALTDMDIADQQDGGMMECELQNDDLMVLELAEMEDKAGQNVAHKSQKSDVKALRGSKYGSKLSAHLGI